MKVLVAGGAGYVGCRLVPELVRRGHDVTPVDTCVYGRLGLWFNGKGWQCDIQQIKADDLVGYDAVINLAGLSNDPTADLWPELNWQLNTEAAIHLAELCVKAGVPRYVLASSCSVYYTDTPSDEIFTEESEIHPTANYSRSKHEAEKGILSLASPTFCPVALRKGTIYGYSPRMRYDLVVNTMLKDAKVSGCIKVNGGQQWRPLLDIEQAVSAYCRMIEVPKDEVSGQIFNVVTNNYRVLAIAREVLEFLASYLLDIKIDCGLEIIAPAVRASRSYRVSGEKYDRTFGLAPMLNRTMREIWNHLNSGINPEDDIYYNIRWLQARCA